MINPFIIGTDIYLRPLRPQDAEGSYVEWLNNPEVCQYNSHHVFPYTPQKALEYIQHAGSTRTAVILAVCLKDGDRHIGNVSLQEIDFRNRSAEFAVMFGDQEQHGKGYARQAARLLFAHGFSELNLNRIACGTSSDNIPMQKLAAALGMREEGRRVQAMFKHGKYADVIEYGVLAAEYESHQVSHGGK